MTLDLLISTLGNDGIKRVAAMGLPKCEGVRYIVAWQLPDGIDTAETPDALKRDDVTLLRHRSIGVSRNRNYALAHSTAVICLTADDDLIYTKANLISVMEAFADNPELDLAGFRVECVSDKWYPDYGFDLRKPAKGYDISEYEMAYRRKSVQGIINFNELLGLNSPRVHAGEGPVSLITALARGLNCRYFPVVIGRQTRLTTGFRPTTDSGIMMAIGVVLYLRHGWLSIFYSPINALRKHRKGYRPFHKGFIEILQGIVYCHRNINRDGTEKKKCTRNS